MKSALSTTLARAVEWSLANTLSKGGKWAMASSLWYYPVATGCCADELLNTEGCRYDLERFGCVPQVSVEQADLLIVSGVVTRKLAPYLRELYDRMASPKHVLAVGACAASGGAFGRDLSYSTLLGVDTIMPVDIFVAGCPPRPEALMNGVLELQKKIREGR